MNNKSNQSARHIAITILHRCQDAKHTLDYWQEQLSDKIQTLNRPDRALLHALVYGVLRWQKRLDWIIDQLAARPSKKIDPLVRIVLRIGLFQILYMDRIPPSAAVNTAVEWVKKNQRSWAAGFVNGILRRAANQNDPMRWPDQEKDPERAIAIQQAFPQWLVSRWINHYGKTETLQLCQTINTIAPMTLRTNTLKTTRSQIMTDLDDLAEAIAPTSYSPEGVRFASPTTSITQWSLFKDGKFQIQDEAAQIISHLLSLRPGLKVWDACAGLGTKTAHMAQLMNNEGTVLATDRSRPKLAKLKMEMQRLSITAAKTHCMDISREAAPHSNFDRILLDAPCSGLGVLQKNPDAKWRIQPEDLKKNGLRQLVLLERVTPHLAKNGYLVYAVCSTEPEENEGVIDRFLQKHQEFGIHTPNLAHVNDTENLFTPKGYLKTRPHRHQMDGFFAVVLKYKHHTCL